MATTIAQLIPLAIQLSMAIIVFCIALKSSVRDVTYLWHKPGLLVRSLLAMYVIMPIFAVALAVLFELNPVVEAAMIALALAPVPPILPRKQIKSGGAPSYAMGLLTIAALISIVFVPLAVALLARIFGRPLQVDPATIALIVATSIFMPFVAGVCVARFVPGFAEKIGKPLSAIAAVLLIVAALPILIKEWPAMVAQLGNFSALAIAVFVAVGLAVGHVLGGPEPDERTDLALSTSTRHPAIAMAIVHQAADKQAVLGAVLLVVITGAIVSGVYVKWRAHVQAQGSAAAARRST